MGAGGNIDWNDLRYFLAAARARTLAGAARNLGVKHSTIGRRLSALERALGGALTAIMTGVSYATSAEMARELGPFPGYEANREAMLRVIRNHARAARGEAEGYEALATAPVPLDHAACPDPRLLAHASFIWSLSAIRGHPTVGSLIAS